MFLSCLEFIWDGMAHAVGFFRSIEIASGVTLWTVLCCFIILSVLIVGLINVVHAGSTSKSPRRRRKDDE